MTSTQFQLLIEDLDRLLCRYNYDLPAVFEALSQMAPMIPRAGAGLLQSRLHALATDCKLSATPLDTNPDSEYNGGTLEVGSPRQPTCGPESDAHRVYHCGLTLDPEDDDIQE